MGLKLNEERQIMEIIKCWMACVLWRKIKQDKGNGCLGEGVCCFTEGGQGSLL